jgi:hypothetical protein
MSKFAKSTLTVDGNTVHVSMPFAKVDKAKRLVSGWATLDNVDSQGDIVLAEASAKAFARARGNIREMHQPIAAGRIVDFREDKYYDKETKKFFTGVFVTAYVSKGAESTWEKVLDGTLTGFSIGGEITDADNEFNKDAGTNVRVIKDYDLVELSLVDNPANQLANVLSIQKSANGSVMKGMVAETIAHIVYICPVDGTVVIKTSDEPVSCPEDGSTMEDAGWYEEGPDREVKVDEIVTKFLAKGAALSDEGGVEMPKENETEEVAGLDTPPVEEPEAVEEEEAAVDVEETSGVEVVETAAPEEVADESDEITKKIDALHKAIEDSLASTKGEFKDEVEAIKKFVAEQMEPLVEKTSELESKLNEFGEKQAAQKSMLLEMEARLEKMNSADAVRKSGEVEEASKETVQKNTIWSPGAFSGKKQFFSANDL